MMEVTGKGVITMKTAEEIVAYLELELADAYEQHDLSRGQERLIHLIRATTILNLLEAINGK